MKFIFFVSVVKKQWKKMFRKYEKTYRIPISQVKVKGKHYLSHKEVSALLRGNVVVEEKLDGANTGVVRHKKGFTLQKRGSLVGPSEHAQFNYFHSWANRYKYDQLMEIPVGYIVYTELLYAVHYIHYDALPDYVIVIDVWNGRKYLNRKEKDRFCEKHGLVPTPLVTEGHFNKDELFGLIPPVSAYGNQIEGIMIKKYHRKNKLYMKGKLVLPDFVKALHGLQHWSRKPLERNKVKKEKYDE